VDWPDSDGPTLKLFRGFNHIILYTFAVRETGTGVELGLCEIRITRPYAMTIPRFQTCQLSTRAQFFNPMTGTPPPKKRDAIMLIGGAFKEPIRCQVKGDAGGRGIGTGPIGKKGSGEQQAMALESRNSEESREEAGNQDHAKGNRR
jgi:hypothetical protein